MTWVEGKVCDFFVFVSEFVNNLHCLDAHFENFKINGHKKIFLVVRNIVFTTCVERR